MGGDKREEFIRAPFSAIQVVSLPQVRNTKACLKIKLIVHLITLWFWRSNDIFKWKYPIECWIFVPRSWEGDWAGDTFLTINRRSWKPWLWWNYQGVYMAWKERRTKRGTLGTQWVKGEKTGSKLLGTECLPPLKLWCWS